MGLFTKKTAEERQAALDAKFAKAEKALERSQKEDAKARELLDKQTAKSQIALMKVGVDTREATAVASWAVNYLAVMPDAVMIYENVSRLNPTAPVKNTETIPYTSINAVELKAGLAQDEITIQTSGETYKFKTDKVGKLIVEMINANR